MACPRCSHCDEVPLWARPEVWLAGAVLLFLFGCSVVALYYTATATGPLGFAVVGMIFYAVPGYLLAGHVAGEIAYARMKAHADVAPRPKWTQQLQQKTRPLRRVEPAGVEDNNEDDEDD
jgi:hypothetical protein